MAKNPKLVHVLVANREPRSSKPLVLRAGKSDIEIRPGKSGQAVLTWEQFVDLHARQRDAVKRTPGILRLVDFWTEVDGARVDVEIPRAEAE